jgi:hypothetical protein
MLAQNRVVVVIGFFLLQAASVVENSLILLSAANAQQLDLAHPLPHQVVQRIGVLPGKGYADVQIVGKLLEAATHRTLQYRIVILGGSKMLS